MKNIKSFVKTILRGVGQIMLQNNPITGLLFLIGIFYNSRIMGVGALIGVFAGTVFAILFKYKNEDINNGLYGFNGTLVGIALTFFFNFNFILVLLIVLFSALSSWVMNFMMKKNFAPFTFPFVLSTWVAIFSIHLLNLAESVIMPPLPLDYTEPIGAVLSGFGQVMFQEAPIIGVIFIIAILVNSRKSAFYGLTGSVVGAFTGLALGASAGLFYEQMGFFNTGIFGYCAVLSAIALSENKKLPYLNAIFASVLSVIILFGFSSLNLIALTAPFVFATWITMFLSKKLLK